MNKPNSTTVTLSADLREMSRNERIKVESRGLFLVSPDGTTFEQEIRNLSLDPSSTLSGTGKELSKFFGVYRQQARGERGKKLKEYFFMVRIKNPGGGLLSPNQWKALDDAASKFADGTLRITSRQAIQYHHVNGPALAPLIRFLSRHYRPDATLAACGDVNRNVMVSPMYEVDPDKNLGGLELAREIANALSSKSRAYFEVFKENPDGTKFHLDPEEPVYGRQYLPRKFKIGIAHPRDNSADILTQDVGWIPAKSSDSLADDWWDLYSGGGLGLTHNNPKTSAHLGLHLGRVQRCQAVSATRAIVTLQRDHGDRKDRKQARWKYTIRRLGIEFVKRELRKKFGIDLVDSVPSRLPNLDLHLGAHVLGRNKYYYGISIPSGRLTDKRRQAIREIVETQGASILLTPHQDLLLCGIQSSESVDTILKRHQVDTQDEISTVRQNSMACPAKPTCGLAMTEAERILPNYLAAIEAAGFGGVDAVIRMTGCPNNCARPPSAEIGIYGYGKNDHVLLVGGSKRGDRLAKVLYDRIPGEDMEDVLIRLFRAISSYKPSDQEVGHFLHTTPVETLKHWIGDFSRR